jgi:hypothetical protein
MLAALLLNLGAGPPPAPPAAIGFGGAPVWWRCYEDDDEECEREAELVREEVPELAAPIERAVEAIQRMPQPEALVLDAAISYERVFESVRASVRSEITAELRIARHERLEKERIGQLWRAEVRRRLREREDDDERMLVLAMLGD